jgi:T5orf172 domain
MPNTTSPEQGGIVYGLTNRVFRGLVKIGRTGGSIQARREQLFTTGVPEPFDIGVAYRVPNPSEVEQALHRAFSPYRQNARREFFQIEVYQVEAILSLLGSDAQAEDVTEAVAADPGLIPNESIRRSPPRPRANFEAMGLPIGTEIRCRRTAATATIAGEHSVLFDGEVMSLTEATRRNYPNGNGAFHRWVHGDVALMDLYDQSCPRPSE